MDGIVFIARLGSTRLKQKHLIQAAGKPFIEWLTERFYTHFRKEIAHGELQLILATSDEPENRHFERVLSPEKITVFYGSVNNIPLRLLECARKFQFENVVSIDGDDILCSPAAARAVWLALRETKNTIMAKTTGLPLGMNVIGFKNTSLESKAKAMENLKLETGWGHVFESIPASMIVMGQHTTNDAFRFTLDYDEDAHFFNKIISLLGSGAVDATDTEIIDVVVQHNLTKINEHLNDVYWSNFNSQKQAEQNKTI